MFLEKSLAHRHQLVTKVEQETARNNERQMEIQHRLHRADPNDERYDGWFLKWNKDKNGTNFLSHLDLCLPAVFMPFRSGNVFNPRAYRYFHSIGKKWRREKNNNKRKIVELWKYLIEHVFQVTMNNVWLKLHRCSNFHHYHRDL